MLLNDIGKSPDTTFRKINQHLETNYGFKIAEDVSDRDLVAIMEQIEEEITELKIKGDDAKASPEISKRLLGRNSHYLVKMRHHRRRHRRPR